MKNLKKRSMAVICMLLVSIFCVGMIPNYAEAATELNVPKYLEANKMYLRAMVKYKDKTFIQGIDGKNLVVNADGTSRSTNVDVENIAFSDQISLKSNGKSLINPLEDSVQWDIENETSKDVKLDSVLKGQVEESIKQKYSLGKNDQISFWVHANHGESMSATWVDFNIENWEENKLSSGRINISTKEILEVDEDSRSYVVDVFDNKLIITEESGGTYIYENGTKTFLPEGWGHIFFNKGKSYIAFDYENELIHVYELSGNTYIKTLTKQIDLAGWGVTDVDANGNLWLVYEANGKSYIGKYENKDIIPKYEIRDKVTSLSVYDDNRIAVCGADWESEELGWYTIIDHKEGSNRPTLISLNKTALNLIKGKSEALIATVKPDNATNKGVKWTSSNTKVATVDSNGKVTAVGVGNADITATTIEGGLTATAKVAVDFLSSDFKNHWGTDYIRKAMGYGWVDSSEKFRPNDAITRAEFIKIVNKAYGYTEVGEEKYSDVYPNDWFYNEIRIAAKAGYISTANPKFRPNDPISREEVAVIVTSINNNKDTNYDKLNKYEDRNKVSPWAKSSVEGAIEAGYMGVGGTKFYPISNITRAEAVTTLTRVVEK